MLSLCGQWVGTFEGSHTGTVVIELDDAGDHYEGTAIAWYDNPIPYNAMVIIKTASKSLSQTLSNLRVVPIDRAGNFVDSDMISRLEKENGILFSETVDVDFTLDDESFRVNWSTPVGTHGRSEIGRKKTLEDANRKGDVILDWDEFKGHVGKLEHRKYVFRGQADSRWKLESSFHRSGRYSLHKYVNKDIYDLNKTVSGSFNYVFDMENPNHYAALLNLAQHHGYPTPLLDWTWSPYIAMFFAFRNVGRKRPDGDDHEYIRIYQFDLSSWNTTLNRANKIFPIWPNVSVVDALALGNPRVIPQNSISTVSNICDIEGHIRGLERKENRAYLRTIDIRISERNRVMRELELMGITAGSLFPGLDGACEGLKERNF